VCRIIGVTPNPAVLPPGVSNYELSEIGSRIPCRHIGQRDVIGQVNGNFFGSEYGAHDFSLACGRINGRFEWIESPPDNQVVRNRFVVYALMKREQRCDRGWQASNRALFAEVGFWCIVGHCKCCLRYHSAKVFCE